MNFLAEQLSGWDFLVAGIIVLIVEYGVKAIFKDGEKYKLVWKLSPVVLGAIIYLVYGIITKQVWYTSLIHGVFVGGTATACYDIILKTIKESGTKALTDTNEAIKEAIGTNPVEKS